MTLDLTSTIRAAEQRRCAAMLANNAAALDALLDPSLHFAHATGVVDDKPALMAKMAAGRIVYTRITWSEDVVTALADDAALLTGRMKTEVEVEGTAKVLNNRVISIWRRTGSDWQLLAFQSTPLAG